MYRAASVGFQQSAKLENSFLGRKFVKILSWVRPPIPSNPNPSNLIKSLIYLSMNPSRHHYQHFNENIDCFSDTTASSDGCYHPSCCDCMRQFSQINSLRLWRVVTEVWSAVPAGNQDKPEEHELKNNTFCPQNADSGCQQGVIKTSVKDNKQHHLDKSRRVQQCSWSSDKTG